MKLLVLVVILIGGTAAYAHYQTESGMKEECNSAVSLDLIEDISVDELCDCMVDETIKHISMTQKLNYVFAGERDFEGLPDKISGKIIANACMTKLHPALQNEVLTNE